MTQILEQLPSKIYHITTVSIAYTLCRGGDLHSLQYYIFKLRLKNPSSQAYGFSSGHVWMWELDCEESWVPKNWCFWTVVLEKTLESPLDCKEIQPVHS